MAPPHCDLVILDGLAVIAGYQVDRLGLCTQPPQVQRRRAVAGCSSDQCRHPAQGLKRLVGHWSARQEGRQTWFRFLKFWLCRRVLFQKVK